MRKFKFRAWHPKLKIMNDFSFLDIVGSPRGLPGIIFDREDGSNFALPTIECNIMQYLGEDCKDADGIEFCEGDIIKNPDNVLAKIIFEKGAFVISLLFGKKNGELEHAFDLIDSKIIGNIYQNPELLEVKK